MSALVRTRMRAPRARRVLGPLVALAITFSATVASASDVLVVDRAGGGQFLSIQPAVNAAVDGDVLLVRAGTYPEDVTITTRALALVADGIVRIEGHLRIADLTAQQDVLVSGFELRPPEPILPITEDPGAIDVRRCLGPVRILACDLRGADAQGPSTGGGYRDGGPACAALDCNDVAAIDCILVGGTGGFAVVARGGTGGAGFRAQDTLRASLVRSVTSGGTGGWCDDGGHGGHGAAIAQGTRLHIAYSALFGGDGGASSIYTVSTGGSGGDGLFAAGGTTVWDLQGIFEGGDPGPTPGTSGSSGQPIGGSPAYHALQGHPSAIGAPLTVREGQQWTIDVFAEAGDEVQLLLATDTGFAFRPLLAQPLFLQLPAVRRLGSSGTVPTGGVLALPRGTARIQPGVDARVIWIQAIVGQPGSPVRFTSPRAVVILDDRF